MEDGLNFEPAFASVISVRGTNAAADDLGYGDKPSPLKTAALQLEWELLRLSPRPPLKQGRAGIHLVNGSRLERGDLAPPDLMQLGKAEGFTVADQVKAFDGVAGLTMAAINSDKPKDGTLMLGKIRVSVAINDEGVFVGLSVSYEWLELAA